MLKIILPNFNEFILNQIIKLENQNNQNEGNDSEINQIAEKLEKLSLEECKDVRYLDGVEFKPKKESLRKKENKDVAALSNEVVKEVLKAVNDIDVVDILKNETVILFLKERVTKIQKYSFWFKYYSKEILGEHHPFSQQFMNKILPFEPIQLLAVLLQNKMTPKNSHRLELINSKQYKDFINSEVSVQWIKSLLLEQANKVLVDAAKDKVKIKRLGVVTQKAKKFAEATTILGAAASLYGTSVGNGEISRFYKELNDCNAPLIKEKLELLLTLTF